MYHLHTEFVEPTARYREPPDFCSRKGAIALMEKIDAYWRERGYEVKFDLQNVGFHPAIRESRYDLRTDMVDGFPIRKLPANDEQREARYEYEVELA